MNAIRIIFVFKYFYYKNFQLKNFGWIKITKWNRIEINLEGLSWSGDQLNNYVIYYLF